MSRTTTPTETDARVAGEEELADASDPTESALEEAAPDEPEPDEESAADTAEEHEEASAEAAGVEEAGDETSAAGEASEAGDETSAADEASEAGDETSAEAGREEARADGDETSATAEVGGDADGSLQAPSERPEAGETQGSDTAKRPGLEKTRPTQLGEAHLKSVLESLVFVADKPITPQALAKTTRSKPAEVTRLLEALAEDYRGRGIELTLVAGGWQFRSAAVNAPFVRDLVAHKPVRLTRAQLEALAIVAYRQPVTRPELEEIRGVDSGSAVKVLADRGLIKIIGRKDEPGRPLLYGTTPHFLEFFGLGSLQELPTLQEFTELSDESRALFERKMGEPLDLSQVQAPEAQSYEDDEGDVDEEGRPAEAEAEPGAEGESEQARADDDTHMPGEPEGEASASDDEPEGEASASDSEDDEDLDDDSEDEDDEDLDDDSEDEDDEDLDDDSEDEDDEDLDGDGEDDEDLDDDSEDEDEAPDDEEKP
jgi:segregation and condensation protein B